MSLLNITCDKSSPIIVPSSSQNSSFVCFNTLLNASYLGYQVELACKKIKNSMESPHSRHGLLWVFTVDNWGTLVSAVIHWLLWGCCLIHRIQTPQVWFRFLPMQITSHDKNFTKLEIHHNLALWIQVFYQCPNKQLATKTYFSSQLNYKLVARSMWVKLKGFCWLN